MFRCFQGLTGFVTYVNRQHVDFTVFTCVQIMVVILCAAT